MKVDYSRYLGPFTIVLLLTWTFSCSGRAGENAEKKQPDVALPVAEAAVKFIKLNSPEENAGIKLNDPLNVSFELRNKNKVPDSVLIVFDGRKLATIVSEPWEYTIPSELTAKTGRKSLKLTAYREGRSQNPITRFIIVYSDKAPRKYGYKVVNIYPHDKHAFTQGLIFDKGMLFEGTGQTTGSSLREVELKTGKVIRQHNLDVSLFGEGITLYQDRIYQVTWQNKVGFIYEKSTFKTINRVFYNTEGWGLTTLGDRIIMSDGTNILYFIEPEMFTVVSRLEVYDNEKKVDALNELEYINGEIWANIWMSDLIARIDPASGKVIAYVDLKGILPEPDRTDGAEVLNGIAYDKDGDRIFVTGKNWPKLFEIRITE